MLKETETEETLEFFVKFLSLMKFQLSGAAPWQRLWMITFTNHVVAQGS